ncbi:unnamed protein product [Gadus morhua 'NCC']
MTYVLFLSAVFTVGVFVDPCKVTHQGKATTYNISNPKSNPTCEYSWADSNGIVLANDQEPKGKGNISSSHRSLTLPGCLKKVCVTIDCHPEHYDPICCPTDCTAALEPQVDFPAAPEPQEHIDPTTSSPALAVDLTPGKIAGTGVGTGVVIAMVIAAVCCRKKISSWWERFKRACSSNEPQSGSGADARPEVIPMLDVDT